MCESRVGKVDEELKLYVNLDKQYFNCFRCSFKGRSLDRLGLDVEAVSYSPNELLDFLGNFKDGTNTNLFYDDMVPETGCDQLKTVPLPESFSKDFTTPVGKNAWRFLLKRGISKRDIIQHNIGYCTTGLFARCVIFPIYDQGKLVFYVGRAVHKKMYKNCPSPNRSVMFNFNQQETMILCEGIIDALHIGKNAVAMLGKSIKNEQVNRILKANPKTIYVFLDDDAQDKAIYTAKKFLGLINTVKLVKPLKGRDPGDMAKSEIDTLLEASVTLQNQGDVLKFMYG